MQIKPGLSTAGAMLAAVLLTAFNLRLGIVATGPVIEEIRGDTGMSSGLAGALTTIPFLCMGIFAFAGGPLVHRHGARRVIVFGLALILAGTVLRALMPAAVLVLGATLPIGIGVALIGVTLPVVVKVHYPGHPGAATGAYVASMSLAIALIGVGLVPVAEAIGGWRIAFLITAVPAALALALWMPSRTRDSGATAGATPSNEIAPPGIGLRAAFTSRLPRRGVVLLATVFGLQSLCFASMIGWAPAIYRHEGWDAQTAALATTVLGLMTIVGALSLPALSDRGDRRHWLIGTLALQTAGVVGLTLFGATWGWLWLFMFGLGNGSTFPLMLALPIDLVDEARTVADVAMWMMGLGYILAATGPLLVGALRDVTAGFEVPLAVLSVAGVVAAVLAATIPARIGADEVTRGRPARAP